jgi:hypothetical protein
MAPIVVLSIHATANLLEHAVRPTLGPDTEVPSELPPVVALLMSPSRELAGLYWNMGGIWCVAELKMK